MPEETTTTPRVNVHALPVMELVQKSYDACEAKPDLTIEQAEILVILYHCGGTMHEEDLERAYYIVDAARLKAEAEAAGTENIVPAA